MSGRLIVKDLDLYFSGKKRAYVQAGIRLISGIKTISKAKARANGVKTFWGFRNFGDLITPLLLEKVGRTPINCPHPAMTDLMMVGSILDPLTSRYKGTILGSGFLNESRSFNSDKANVAAVRGLLTKKRLGVSKDVVLGDPGLLMSVYFSPEIMKNFKVGVVPHYSELEDPRIIRFLNRFREESTLINVLDHPVSVYNKVSQCDLVVSSSLHGLVLADSLDIPNVWMSLSSRSRFKYDDYYTAFGVSRDPHNLTGEEDLDFLFYKAKKIKKTDVENIKNELNRVFVDYVQG